MTQRLLDYLEKESLLRPFREVALEVGLSARTVREIFNVKKGVAEVERSATLTSPRVLGIDGVYINRKQCAILTDIENKEIIDIWESANADPLTEELKKLPDRDKIEVVIMDMAGPLKKAVEAALPRATIVIDRYHIQRMGNQAMDNVRIRLTPKRTSKAKRTMCERSLLRKHRSQLKKSEEMELKRWFSIMPELKLAYDLKEDFFSIWHTARKSTAKKRYSQWLLSLPLELKKDFKDILSAMNNWGEYIFNFFDFQDKKHTNAFTESTNRRIKDIQREARRGRFETVRAKAIYGTIMRKQLKEARTQQARPTWKRKNGERVVSEILLESSVLRELPSIQMSLF
jgi:transposase